MDDNNSSSIVVVLFGIPGAGKSTVAKRVVEKLLGDATTTTTPNSNNKKLPLLAQQQQLYYPLGLDLDVCIPQWMKDNFNRGIYPTLEQRTMFAQQCCDYVDTELQRRNMNHYNNNHKGITTTYNDDNDDSGNKSSSSHNNPAEEMCHRRRVTLVSFSFMNHDLRDHFRVRFPKSHWILLDTSTDEAQRRIETRQGHFYQGAPPKQQQQQQQQPLQQQQQQETRTNLETEHPSETEIATIIDVVGQSDDWAFAPVDFPHTVLNGLSSVEENAERIVSLISKWTKW